MSMLLHIQLWVSKLYQTKLSLLRILLQSTFSNIVKGNTQHKGLLILGNGPSLNDTLATTDLKTIKRFDLLAVNNAANDDKFIQLKPSYYLLNAVTYFQEDHELNEFYIHTNHSLFESLKTKTTWDMTLLLPFRAKKSNAINSLLVANSHLKVAYFNQTPIEGFTCWTNRWYSKGLGMPRPHNVLIPGIMVGIRLGYRQITIVGADHSWLQDLSVNEHNEALLRHVHYYDPEGTKPMKVEDRIAEPRKLHEIIHKFYLSFQGYWTIKAFAKHRGVTIVNASKVSMIDAFDRKELMAILTEIVDK